MNVYRDNVNGSGDINNMTDEEAEAALELELAVFIRGAIAAGRGEDGTVQGR